MIVTDCNTLLSRLITMIPVCCSSKHHKSCSNECLPTVKIKKWGHENLQKHLNSKFWGKKYKQTCVREHN
jgi:hypothetical protein